MANAVVHLAYCVPFWLFSYWKDVTKLERVQKRFTIMLPGHAVSFKSGLDIYKDRKD